MSYGHGSTGGLCGPPHSLLALCCTTHCTTQFSSPLVPPPPFPFLLLCPWCRPLGVLLGSTRLLVAVLPGRVGGGAPDAGSGPSLREFPHGGADACTPRQGVTLLYGPSICTRSVQMDLRRNQVRQPFPTPGSGTLWVSGESLRDRRVSCLPRWRVCPTRSPSQDTNRSTCRGKCSWSGPLADPPSRCHLGPLANGPGRNPPYCLRSGGADTDTGGAPKPLRSGTSPASFAGSCHPAPPPFAAVLARASQLSSPGVSPFPAPLAVLPGSCRVPSAPAVCPCSGALVSFVFFSFLAPPPLATRLFPRRLGLSSAPPPCPLAISSLSSPLSWVGGGEGGEGGGRPRCPSSGVSTLQARRRHEARHLSLCRGGGGLPCGSRRRPSYPAFAPPVPPPLGLARRVLPTGTVVWSVPHPLSATSPPCRFVLGGGGRCPPLPTFTPHPWGGGGVCGGGGGLSSSLRCTHVAGTTQARRRHGARHLSLCRGGGHALWLPSSPFLPCVRTPGGPPAGACTARALFGYGRVVRPAPSRRCLPTLPLCPRGGGALFAPPYLHPPPLGGRRCSGGGGGGRPCRLPFVAHTSRARCKHGAGTRRGTCPSARGGGGCRVSPVVAPPTLRAQPRGGGVVWGGGGAPLSLSLRCTHVGGTTQARRKHGVRHLAAAGGGGVSPLGLPALLHGKGSAPHDLQPLLPLGGSRHVSAWCLVSRACSLLCPYLPEEVRTRVETDDEEVRAAGRTYRTPRRLLAPSAALVEGRAPVSAPNSPGGDDCPSSPWCLCILFRAA